VKNFNKLSNPSIMFIIFLTVADEDVVFVSWYNAWNWEKMLYN